MKKLMAFVLTLALLCTMAMPALAAKEDNSVTVNINTEPPQMFHIKATDSVSFRLFRHLLVGLTDLDADNQPIPGVAESWTVSEDGLVYTYKLREDAKWEDGTPVTAHDFVFAVEKLLDPAVAADYSTMAYCIKNAEAYYKSMAPAEVTEGSDNSEEEEPAEATEAPAETEETPAEATEEAPAEEAAPAEATEEKPAGELTFADVGVKALDDYTYEVTLEHSTPYFNSLMAFGVFMPLRQDKYEEWGDKYGTDAEYFISNGPFKMESWQHEFEIVMVKNEEYFAKDEIKLDKIVNKMINDNSTAYNNFSTGELDVTGLSGQTLALAKQDGLEANMSEYGDGSTFYIQFNLDKPVTGNLNIRKALTYALDRQSFVENIMKTNSKPALTYTSIDIAGLDGVTPFSESVEVSYKDNDVEQAKEFWEKGLEELGMTAEEAAKELTIIADDSDVAKEYAAAYQEYWRKALGITIEVESMPFKSRLQRTTDREYTIVSGGWGADYNDPLTFLDIFTTDNANNQTGWSNAEFDKLIADSNVEVDPAKRMEMLTQAETILLNELPIGPVYNRIVNYLADENLEGIVCTAFQNYNLTRASWK